jgi:hypothetical protein
MRRRLDLEKLSDQILFVLHEKFFDDQVSFVTFESIRTAIKNQPSNAIRLELNNLVSSHKVSQRTEERERNNFAGFPLSKHETYLVPLDGYRLTKSGIQSVNKFDDKYFEQLQSELASNIEQVDGKEWEPIPLDRADVELANVTQALDSVAEELRGANGYAATNPEEKAFVQDKLSAVAKRLKEESQISWMYLQEFAFKPLGMLIERFGKAAIGLAALTAREAFKSWLKSKGISFLDSSFS